MDNPKRRRWRWLAACLCMLVLYTHAWRTSANNITEPSDMIAERTASSVSVYRGDTLNLGVKPKADDAKVSWYRLGEVVGNQPTMTINTATWFPGVHILYAVISDGELSTQLQWSVTVLTPQIDYQPTTVTPKLEPLSKPRNTRSDASHMLSALRGAVVGYRGSEPLRVEQSGLPVYWSESLYTAPKHVGVIRKKHSDETYLLDEVSAVLGLTSNRKRVVQIRQGAVRLRNFLKSEAAVTAVVGAWFNLSLGPHADVVVEVFDEAEGVRILVSTLQGDVRVLYGLGSSSDAQSKDKTSIVLSASETIEFIQGSYASQPLPVDVENIARIVAETTPGYSRSGCVKAKILSSDFPFTKTDIETPFLACEAWVSRSKTQPKHAKEWYTLGLVRFGVYDLEGARRAFKKSYQEDPESPQAAFALGMLLTRVKQWEAAQVWLKRAAVLGYRPQLDLEYARGIAYMKTGYPASAQHHLSVAANLDPNGDIGQSARQLINHETVTKKFHLRLKLQRRLDSVPFPVFIDADPELKQGLHSGSYANQINLETGFRWNKDEGVRGEILYALDRQTYDELPGGVESQSVHKFSGKMSLLFGSVQTDPTAEFWLGPSSRLWIVENEQSLHTYEVSGGLRFFLWSLAPDLFYERVRWRDYRQKIFDPVSELTPWLGGKLNQSAEEIRYRLTVNLLKSYRQYVKGSYGFYLLMPTGESEMRSEHWGLSYLWSHPILGRLSYEIDASSMRRLGATLGQLVRQEASYRYLFNYAFSIGLFWKRDFWDSELLENLDRKQAGASVEISF